MSVWGTWAYDDEPWRMGSRALEQRLRESLAVLAKTGVRIPGSGRHKQAIALLNKWNNSDDELDLRDENVLQRLEAAHRTAWETYEIAIAAEHHRKKWLGAEDLFTPLRLSTMLRGPELDSGSDTSARDAQFELYIGAEFVLGGL